MLALTFPALTFWRKRYRSSSIPIGWRFLVVCQNIVTRSKFVKFVRFSKLALRTEPLAAFAPFSSLFPSSAANSPTTCLPRHANPTCQPANPSTRQPVNPSTRQPVSHDMSPTTCQPANLRHVSHPWPILERKLDRSGSARRDRE